MHDYPQYFPVRGASDELDVVSLLRKGLRGDPRRTLLCFEEDPWSGGRMALRIGALQEWFASLRLGRGDRVAVMLRNEPDHVALIYALILSGLVWVPVNTRFKGPGIAYLIDHCRPAALVGEAAFEAVIAEAVAQSAHRMPLCRLPAFDPAPGQTEPVATDSQPGDTLCIIYTSGTTGAPKGVIFTHRMLRIAGEAALIAADARSGDRLFLWEPLCHIGGAQMLLVPFLVEAELHLVPGFSASRFWSQIAAAGATQLHYLGGILDILMGQPESRQPSHHTLRVAWGAGVSAKAWEPIRRRMGFVLRECYGMTEGSSFATVNATGKPGSIGRPLPWLRLELLDDEDRPVAIGDLGQIVLSSDVEGVFLPGYLDDPQATAQSLRGGKLYTGDIARQDADGDLYFVGRRTDSMRVRGENVSAWEIERVFATHPAIAAVAAVGVQGAAGEQEIFLNVQFRPGAEVAFPALAAWADRLLAPFQQPRYYARVSRFELTPSERIRKHLLSRDVSTAWDRLASRTPA